uniref:Uncharacterized protein n=1 Tax=Anguilla anguilla TaxID=7936 RepID=A0A0E9RBT3_ANGAN
MSLNGETGNSFPFLLQYLELHVTTVSENPPSRS